MDGFDSSTQRRFGEGSKALSITMAVVIFAGVLLLTWRAVNYLFNRAEYLRDSIRGGMKRVVLGGIILFFLFLLILLVINILGKYQIEKEHVSNQDENKN